MSIRDTVQLPPIQFLPPPWQAILDDVHVDRVGMMTASSAMRSAEAASIQWPFQPGPQLGEDFLGVVAALTGDDDLAGLQRFDVRRVLRRRSCRRFPPRRPGLAARRGGGEIHRIDMGEIALFHHALHQDGTDHARQPTRPTLFIAASPNFSLF